MTVVTADAPRVTASDVTFFCADPTEQLSGVALSQELVRPRLGPPLGRDGSARWSVTMARPAVDRMEYRFELSWRDGSHESVCDPSNPLRAPGPFGHKSVIEFPGYEAPAWTTGGAPRGEVRGATIHSHLLRAEVAVEVWSSGGEDPRAELPLLVVHDGPDYARYAGLLEMLAARTGDGGLPPMRAVLLPPVDREQSYSASASYGRALAHEILPALARLAPTPPGRRMRVGMGASLGALGMLHAHRLHPATFGALFLQSGSFFRQRFDSQEAGFVRFRRISRFLGRVLGAEPWAHPLPITITCGAVEENLTNNLAMRDALVSQGYEVSFFETRDAHNWIAWRDALDPHLTRLLARVWS